jgi:hypothetical protein
MSYRPESQAIIEAAVLRVHEQIRQGWNQSFFGDLHIQGSESVHFYTRQKMTLTRWFASSAESHHDPVWKTTRS